CLRGPGGRDGARFGGGAGGGEGPCRSQPPAPGRRAPWHAGVCLARSNTASTLAVAQISALVVGGAHLLRRADRTEDDALELVGVGSVPLRIVDPQARRFINDNARCLLV